MKWLSIIAGLFVSAQSFAFQCYFTLAKDSCWTNYNVSVTVTDANTEQVVTELTVPKGQSWLRQAFECEPNMKLNYKATFNPIIWESEAGKIYPANKFWSLPETINPADSAWVVSVCYPDAFSEVPLPPTANNKCACDFSVIPPIPPKKM